MSRLSRLSALALVALPALAAAAEPVPTRTVTILPAKNAALALRLELALERDGRSVVLPGALQDEARQQLAMKAMPTKDEEVLKFGRAMGAQWVVALEPTARVCEPALNRCRAVEASPAALMTALEVNAKPEQAEGVTDDALKALAACRTALRSELTQLATKVGGKAKASTLSSCTKLDAKAKGFGPAMSASAAAKALASGQWRELAEVARTRPDDNIAATAWAYLVLNDSEIGLELWRTAQAEAAALAPRSVELPLMRAEGFYKRDQLETATEHFGRAVFLAPENAYLLTRSSYATHLRGKHAESLTLIERALKQVEGGLDLKLEYASRLIDVKRFDEAVMLLELIQAADPKWARPKLRLGYARLRQGKLDEAIKQFEAVEKGVSRSPREASDKSFARLDLARAHALAGRPDAAFAQLEKLHRAGDLMAVDLRDTDFDSLRADARYRKMFPLKD